MAEREGEDTSTTGNTAVDTHTYTHSITHTLSHSHTHTLSLSLTHTYTYTHLRCAHFVEGDKHESLNETAEDYIPVKPPRSHQQQSGLREKCQKTN